MVQAYIFHFRALSKLSIKCRTFLQQSCPLFPKFGRSPEFGGFQEIAQKTAQKILCYSQIGSKHSPKSFCMLPNVPKISRNSTEFLSFFQKKLLKSSPICQTRIIQSMMIVSMLSIVLDLRSFLTAVTKTAVAPTAQSCIKSKIAL